MQEVIGSTPIFSTLDDQALTNRVSAFFFASTTLKLLAERLDLSLTRLQEDETLPTVLPVTNARSRINRSQKIILTFGSPLMLFLLTIAFIAQSPRFPETQFELFLLLAGVVAIYGFLLFRIWR